MTNSKKDMELREKLTMVFMTAEHPYGDAAGKKLSSKANSIINCIMTDKNMNRYAALYMQDLIRPHYDNVKQGCEDRRFLEAIDSIIDIIAVAIVTKCDHELQKGQPQRERRDEIVKTIITAEYPTADIETIDKEEAEAFADRIIAEEVPYSEVNKWADNIINKNNGILSEEAADAIESVKDEVNIAFAKTLYRRVLCRQFISEEALKL